MSRRLLVLPVGVVLLVLLVLGVAQLVLPGVATRRLRSSLARSGKVQSVSVSAFPAIELLWHHADRVTVRMRTFSSSGTSLEDSFGRLGDAGTVSATAATARVGLITVRAARLTVRAGRVVGEGTVEQADLRSAIPFLRSVEPVASAGGTLVLRGTASVLGLLGVSVNVSVRAVGGALIAAPDGPLAGLAIVRLFTAPSIAVSGVRAARLGGPGGALAVVVSGRVR